MYRKEILSYITSTFFVFARDGLASTGALRRDSIFCKRAGLFLIRGDDSSLGAYHGQPYS